MLESSWNDGLIKGGRNRIGNWTKCLKLMIWTLWQSKPYCTFELHATTFVPVNSSVWYVMYQDCYAVKENFRILWLRRVVLHKFLKKQTTSGSTLRYACCFLFEAKFCEFLSIVEWSWGFGVWWGTYSFLP